ncbi:bifunctional adenosylcobinamide kinase/adenosylcobinamide-phosphate guanylyltransferase [Pelotomaculum terephthalicicum JT]|nr:bifunctional adenosylcobinamide kinase/adenosylcobinamide-phosphate guanylyltransferase [Pelotomaculum sp. PtaB.Bin117]MCG9968161.1 bifunctional adenosylcobinamide kinase/adenosylcobinamide-phosphate guanylyltransferase [Pelotomaculum terephthalicicum JT]OPX83943.1 MAG: Bifunctional adenosylcobalamin biosynthesis protein CobU [Pelotomaculum sp. PtaB.Bin117]OPY63180.1 MAG: Bifunctional adenosylcobalamin biosynthesis protein CobU [Pelotomaculum sp. PtaU1.Bin065]
MKGKLILILGGARSGKSKFAEKVAVSLGGKITYIATAAPLDKEMAERIRLHQASRPGDWQTVEEQKNVAEVILNGRKGDVFLLDCITLWLTNMLLDEQLPGTGATRSEKEMFILAQAARLAEGVKSGAHLVVVSNEVGMGIVPDASLGRTFRDLAGKVNQVLAGKADRVYLVIAGLPLELKATAGTGFELDL